MGADGGFAATGFSPEDFGVGRLFHHIRDAVVVANARTEQIVLWNECAANLFGYSGSEAFDLPLHCLVPESLRDLHRTGIARYQQTGGGNLIDGGNPVELKGLHKEGHEVPIELTLTKIPEQSPEGDRFVLAIIRDITERKQAEMANLKLQEVTADRRRALELNDTIVQGLTIAKLAVENDQRDMALRSLTETLKRAQALVTRLLRQKEADEGELQPGDLIVGGEPPPGDAGSP